MALSNEERKSGIQSVRALKENIKKDHEKEIKKFYRPIDINWGLKDFLSALTKAELDEIRKYWGFKGLSSLKKNDLIDVLSNNIVANIKDKAELFNNDQLSFINKIIKNDGYFVIDDIDEKLLAYYRKLGFIFSGIQENKKFVVMPIELKEKCKTFVNDINFRKRVNSNDKWIKVTKGILHYYGAMTSIELISMIKSIVNEGLTSSYQLLISEGLEYGIGILKKDDIYYHIDVWDVNAIVKEHAKRSDITYFPLTYKAALTAGEGYEGEWSTYHKRFLSFIMYNYEISREDAQSLVNECVYLIKNNSTLPFMLKFLQQNLELHNLELREGIINHLNQVRSHTRSWLLKGHTMDEVNKLMQKPLEKNKRVGRNDPCPCGSGKKFKKCCGKH